MPELPKDPAMLLSFVNMKLRDEYNNSPEALCDDWGITIQALTSLMANAGWEWNPTALRFW